MWNNTGYQQIFYPCLLLEIRLAGWGKWLWLPPLWNQTASLLQLALRMRTSKFGKDLGLSCSHQDLQQLDFLSSVQLEREFKTCLAPAYINSLHWGSRQRGWCDRVSSHWTRVLMSSFHISHVAFRQKSGAKYPPITWSKLLRRLLPKFWARFWLPLDI